MGLGPPAQEKHGVVAGVEGEVPQLGEGERRERRGEVSKRLGAHRPGVQSASPSTR